MASAGDSRYAPPSATVADVAPPSALVLASRWRRWFGVVIDGMALLAVSMPLAWIGLPTWWRPSPGLSPSQYFLSVNLYSLSGAALFLLVNGYLLVVRGQTIGKMALGMRIVRPDGAKASAGRVLGLRYGVGYVVNLIPVGGFLYGLLDCLLIFRASRRCLHDEIADTIVVRP